MMIKILKNLLKKVMKHINKESIMIVGIIIIKQNYLQNNQKHYQYSIIHNFNMYQNFLVRILF